MFDGAAEEAMSPEANLRKALERNELRLHWQPIVDISTGKIRGAEALMRWQRGDKLVPPCPANRQPRRGQDGKLVTQYEFARAGIITEEMIYVAHRENLGREKSEEGVPRYRKVERDVPGALLGKLFSSQSSAKRRKSVDIGSRQIAQKHGRIAQVTNLAVKNHQRISWLPAPRQTLFLASLSQHAGVV